MRFAEGWLSCGMNRLRVLLSALWVPMLMLPLLLWLHLHGEVNSMLNLKFEGYGPDASGLSTTYLNDMVQYHQTEPSFARRPLLTQAILQLSGWSPWSVAQIWLALQLLGWLLVAALLYFLAGGGRTGWWSQLFFFTGFSVLFSWFPPIYTYDEPLQYTLLLGVLLALKHDRLSLALGLFGISLWARETGWLLWPALAWMYGTKAGNRLTFFGYSAFWLGLYLLWWFYGSYRIPEAQQPADEVMLRLTLFERNFGPERWGETLWTLLLVLGLPLLLGWRSAAHWPLRMRQGFWLAVVLNTVVVLVTSVAREARLLALPLLLALPYLGESLRLAVLQWWQMGHKRWWVIPILMIMAMWLPQTYVQSGANPAENYFHEYLTGYLVLLGLVLWGSFKQPEAGE